MKKILYTILLLICCLAATAQKELWGVNKGANDGGANPNGYKGNITKYDSNGENPNIIHEFLDSTTGKFPAGKLLLASNGKLYGTTIAGGNITIPGLENGNGVLYEYDLILNKYKVLHKFDFYPGSVWGKTLIEPIMGKIYGAISNKVFYFDIATETFTFLTGQACYTIDGEFTKASNGFLYGMTNANTCPSINAVSYLNYGTIIKIDIIKNTVQQVYQLNCNGQEGVSLRNKFIEAKTGKLYGVTQGGWDYTPTINGTLFEFDITTNTFTKKVDFDGDNLGKYPQDLIDAGNGKLYGVCQEGGTNVFYNSSNGVTYTTHRGTIFEYNTTNNNIAKLHDFGGQQGPPEYSSGVFPVSIMKASTGLYFGVAANQLFKFNPANNSAILTLPWSCAPPACPTNANFTDNLIEICRKPFYKEIIENSFTKNIADDFIYDIQNTNATEYEWQLNGVKVAGQNTGILNLTNITSANAGVYTCTMTNECGTTVTAPLTLKVNSLGVNSVEASLKNAITIYPNPTKNIVNIKISQNNITIQKIIITNLLGQTIFYEEKNNTKIDVNKFQTGIYMIKLITDKGNWSSKFVKE